MLITERPLLIFGAWLALAPFMQAPGAIGHVKLAVYLAPPALLGLSAFAVNRSRAWLPFRNMVDRAPAMFAFYVVIFAIGQFGPYVAPSMGDLIRTVYGSLLIGPLVYYVCLRYVTTANSQGFLIRILLISGLAVSLMLLAERWSGWTLWGDAGWHGVAVPRMVGPFQNPAVAGTFIGVTFVLGLTVLLYDAPRSLRRIAVASIIFGLPALYLTQTRACVIAVLLISLGLLLAQRRFRLITVMVALLAVVTLLGNWQAVETSRVYRLRINNTANADTRINLTYWSLELAAAKPLTGWGLESFDLVKHSEALPAANAPSASSAWATSHNSFLTILVEFGLIGLGLFLYPWYAISYAAARQIRAASEHRWLFVGCLAMLAVYTVNALSIDMRFFSYTSMLPWLMLGLARAQLRHAT